MESKPAKTKETKTTETGRIIVITGRTCSGKDYINDRLHELDEIKELNLHRVVSHNSRPARNKEIPGLHYHFVSYEELIQMRDQKELVEEPVKTGTSFKATSKAELLRVLNGENLCWRIDLTLASKIVQGKFFQELFDEQTAEILHSSTTVLLIDADEEIIMTRQQNRDDYNPKDYNERNSDELETLKQYGHLFINRINNPDGKIEKTLQEVLKIIVPKLI